MTTAKKTMGYAISIVPETGMLQYLLGKSWAYGADGVDPTTIKKIDDLLIRHNNDVVAAYRESGLSLADFISAREALRYSKLSEEV